MLVVRGSALNCFKPYVKNNSLSIVHICIQEHLTLQISICQKKAFNVIISRVYVNLQLVYLSCRKYDMYSRLWVGACCIFKSLFQSRTGCFVLFHVCYC